MECIQSLDAILFCTLKMCQFLTWPSLRVGSYPDRPQISSFDPDQHKNVAIKVVALEVALKR
jgi:hypothetical protein